MKKTADELLRELTSPDCSLSQFIFNNKGSFFEDDIELFWKNIISRSNLSNSQIINMADFSYCYFYEVIGGRKAPTKDKVVRLALVMKMDITECQQALRLSGRASLHPNNRRDCILIYSIEKGLATNDCNNLLLHFNEEQLR